MPLVSTLSPKRACLCTVTHRSDQLCHHVAGLFVFLSRADLVRLPAKNETVPAVLFRVLSARDQALYWVNHSTPPPPISNSSLYTIFVLEYRHVLPTRATCKFGQVGKELLHELYGLAADFPVDRDVDAIRKKCFVSLVHTPEKVKNKDGKMTTHATFRVAVEISIGFSATLVDTLTREDSHGYPLVPDITIVYYDAKKVDGIPILTPNPFPVQTPDGKCVVRDFYGKKTVREDTPRPDCGSFGSGSLPPPKLDQRTAVIKKTKTTNAKEKGTKAKGKGKGKTDAECFPPPAPPRPDNGQGEKAAEELGKLSV